MSDPEFIYRLARRLRSPLPGLEAQLKMAPLERRKNVKRIKVPDNARQSAVLVLLYPHATGSWHLPIQVRNAYNGVHSRQLGLPGGGKEPFDSDYEATALRETEEELGVPVGQVQLLGRLSPLYIPPSNYYVQPIVGTVTEHPQFIPDPSEVAELLEVPVHDFLNPANEVEATIDRGNGMSFVVPSFQIMGRTLWGATAMMMSEFREVVRSL